MFIRVGDRKWRVKAERSPDRAGDLIVRTESWRTFIGAHPDDLLAPAPAGWPVVTNEKRPVPRAFP